MRKLTMVAMLFAAAGLTLMAFRPGPTMHASRTSSHTIVADTVPARSDSSGTDTSGAKTDTPSIQVDTGSTTPPGN